MTKNTRFSPEVRQRAVRMVLESQGEYDSTMGGNLFHCPKDWLYTETLLVCGFVSMSGIHGVVMVDSPPAERQRLKELGT